MDMNMFKGVIAPICSPCDREEGVDYEALSRNMDKLMATDIKGLYINGGTGDGGKLTTAEREKIVETLMPALKAAGKIGIVHVGSTNLREAKAMALHAAANGAAAIASVPPRAGWNEIVKYYEQLASTGVPTIVYYMPGATGVTGGLADLRRLLDIPGVIGMKVSDWNIFFIKCLKSEYPDKIIYTGLDEMLVPGLSYGADGTIGTWINLLPEFYCKVWELNCKGEYDKLHILQDAYTEFLTGCWKYGVLDCFQEIMRYMNLSDKCFREPGSWIPGTMTRDEFENMKAQIDMLTALAEKM